MRASRRSFIISMAGMILPRIAFAESKSFEDSLKDEVEHVIKKHAHEENNESTHRFIEAEIDDWAHMHVMSGEIDALNVICECTRENDGFQVKCIFRKHGSKDLITVLVVVERC